MLSVHSLFTSVSLEDCVVASDTRQSEPERIEESSCGLRKATTLAFSLRVRKLLTVVRVDRRLCSDSDSNHVCS